MFTYIHIEESRNHTHLSRMKIVIFKLLARYSQSDRDEIIWSYSTFWFYLIKYGLVVIVKYVWTLPQLSRLVRIKTNPIVFVCKTDIALHLCKEHFMQWMWVWVIDWISTHIWFNAVYCKVFNIKYVLLQQNQHNLKSFWQNCCFQMFFLPTYWIHALK